MSRARPGRTGSHTSPRVSAGCAILTVSDTRGPADDGSGDRAQALLIAAGHRVVARRWSKDARAVIRRAALALLRRPDTDVLIVTGGTGVAPRDVTPEALEPLYARSLPGFGERFRARSEAQVGSAAWLSRASAGVARGRLLVLLPGATAAVELALEELVIPELGHVLGLLGRTSQSP
jgi:molybdenum cofactor biosynthesis protein B